MAEEGPGTRTCEFKPGDHVAIASLADLPKISFDGSISQDVDRQSCFELIGTVKGVNTTGDVQVTFQENIQCTIEPEALIKMPDLLPGTLVRLVDDIRGNGNLKLADADVCLSETEEYGGVGLVLERSAECGNKIPVLLGQRPYDLSPFHLDIVARPLDGDFMARVTQYACHEPVSAILVENVFNALQESMQDLPDVHIFPSNTSSSFSPGDMVKVSSNLEQFVEWHLEKSSGTIDPSTTLFQTLKDYARVDPNHSEKNGFPTEQLLTLKKPGKIVQVNSECETIVEFSDGRAWCIRSRFLKPDNGTNTPREVGTRLIYPQNRIKRLVNYALENQNQKSLAATRQACLFAACFSDKDLCQKLLHGDKDVNCEDANGNTPLHYAAHGDQPEIIKFLLSERANINATNKRRHTALHFAVKENFVDCVRALTKHSETLNTNIPDNFGNTPLHIAIANRNADIVKELLNVKEADFALTNKDGLNTLHVAALKGNSEVAMKVLSGRNDLVDVRQEDQGNAALHFAAENGHDSVVKTLLWKGSCTVDLETKHKETALLLATRQGHLDIVELLVDADANINKRDQQGNTALHISLMKVNEQSPKPLVRPASHGMNMIYSDILKVVQKHCDHSATVVDGELLLPFFLVARGANIYCKNKEDKDPAQIAYSLQRPAMELLCWFSVEAWKHVCYHCNQPMSPNVKGGMVGLHWVQAASSAGHSSTGNQQKKEMEVRKVEYPKRGSEKKYQGAEFQSDASKTATTVSCAAHGPNSKVYKMIEKPRGMCIIINNTNFRNHLPKREGSEIDVQNMQFLFRELHFDVSVKTDLMLKDVVLELWNAASAESQQNADCLVVILMSHGANGVISGADGEELPLLQGVYKWFNESNCPGLKGKPKIFFVQACRGPLPNNTSGSFAADAVPLYPASDWTNMYFAYATIPNYSAWRNLKTGSRFLSAVYRQFPQHAATLHLDELMDEVAGDMEQHPASGEKPQVPKFAKLGWKKRLYFNPGYWE